MSDILIENIKKLSVRELFYIYGLSIPSTKDLIVKEVENRINQNKGEKNEG